ncbi:DISP complex protein LRCH3 isoform X2 [Stigmatopora nigra]
MAAGDGAQLPATVASASRSVEKALEDAAASGSLHLTNRKLKEFPRNAINYDLSDITHADLSKNRLCELPEELGHFISLETLSLYHNGMRSLSPCLGNLQALTYLNLSRNLLSSLSSSVFELPLLRVLIVSNNKLSSLPASVLALAHLRQLDLSCNDLQCLPVELGQLECLRDLNLRRNQLRSLPEEISELPLVRLDVSCNRITRVPLCYRHLRHLQSISLDNNPLQMPPAQICSKGKYHIFKYLNMEACKRSQEELEKHLRPTGFNGCLSDQEFFPSQFGGLDSGFNSVDSGSKRWSGNESADDFSERSLRVSEVGRDRRNLEEEEEEEEEEESPIQVNKVNGKAERLEFMDGGLTEEDEEPRMGPKTQPSVPESKEKPAPSHDKISPIYRPRLHVDIASAPASTPPNRSPTSSPTSEERRRPGTLLIWQERERLQQQLLGDKSSSLKPFSKTGNLAASATRTGSSSPDGQSPETSPSHRSSGVLLLQRSRSRTEGSPSSKTSPPSSANHKPNSFLFRTSSRGSVRPTGISPTESRLYSPKEDTPDAVQLRKTLEDQLNITLGEDLEGALSDGTVLCQLVNSVRPRTVSIIHIPSPAAPKLSSAKSRLNVENFIAACRKLGVPEDALCSPQLAKDDKGLRRLARTVQFLEALV